jgi:radical SAM protein with 4Fe4S-binding SPASM domain
MNLRSTIIVRKEADRCLLYNGDNGALIDLSTLTYGSLFTRHCPPDPGLHELCDWLRTSGFLDVDSEQPRKIESVGTEPVSDGFYDLRSQLNPYNVLWALTPRCNLRCVYCFPDAYSFSKTADEPSRNALLSIAEQIIEAKVFKVTLTGGEAILSPFIWDIIERLRCAGLTVAVLTNGSPVNDQVVARLKGYGVCVGVSLDGPTDQVTRLTRGRGAFRRSVLAIMKLVNNSVPVSVLVVVTTYNFNSLREHVSFVRNLGADAIILQDLRPFGTREIYNRTRLTATQENGLRQLFDQLRSDNPGFRIDPSELFICSKKHSGDTVMPCPAGDNFVYIDFLGDVYPCTSLPSFKMGNVFAGESLTWLWRYSEAIHALRKIKEMRVEELPGCASCDNLSHCEGGCRGDALFHRGDLFGRPSRCPQEIGLLGDRS